MPNDRGPRLRPVEERDLTALELLDIDPALSEPFEWRGFRDPKGRRRRWETDGYLGEHDALLMVESPDGETVGIVVWRAVPTSGPLGGCLQVGILLFPEHRGQGLGAAAQRVLAEYLFATTLANRLEATTEAENIAEQRALERAGFVREGVLHGRGFARGAWRDGVMYARLRNDPDQDATQMGDQPFEAGIRGFHSQRPSASGFPVLSGVPGHLVTDELVASYRDDESAPGDAS